MSSSFWGPAQLLRVALTGDSEMPLHRWRKGTGPCFPISLNFVGWGGGEREPQGSHLTVAARPLPVPFSQGEGTFRPCVCVCVCVCVLFGEQSSGGCQRGMIYKVETSLKCAGVCGRDLEGEGERRKPRTRAGWRHSLGWRGPGGAGTARRAIIW